MSSRMHRVDQADHGTPRPRLGRWGLGLTWGLVFMFAVAWSGSGGGVASLWAQNETGLQVEVQLPAETGERPQAGRLFLFTTQRLGSEPRRGPNWFNPEPFYGIDVTDWEPGTARWIDDTADGFPGPLSELPEGKYRIQALFDQDFYSPSPADGIGNRYSDVAVIEVAPDQAVKVTLVLDQLVEPVPWPDSQWVKPIEYRSDLLREFHGREVLDRAAVVLPASYYDQPQRRYPVVYVISGFGGTLRGMARPYFEGPIPAQEDEVEFIRVLLTGECKWGHHVYADSQTNGPRGQVLIEELIPLVEREFRAVADPRARYVMGHSSGGWSSLWLQVRYPEVFGGVWSTSPDPVDFRDFQQTDLYAQPPESVYFWPDGTKKPLARRGTEPVVWYPDFAKMDDVLKRGGQLRSFEAVFSEQGADGEPLRLWDRETGKVDPAVAATWKPYDIRLRLRDDWDRLAPLLAGKIHVTMGELDTFYLEGATELLKEQLEALGSDAQITLVPGADHGSVLTAALRREQRQQMSEAYLQYFDREGKPR